MDSLAIVNEYIKVLTEEADVESYYSDKVNWAKYRKGSWENDLVRVGVIGITSSGKSTLINALLGCDILSSAVVPSSGQLVCCSYGNDFQATVLFSDKEPVILKNDDFCTEKLMVFSDERMNPKNCKNVVSIEIQSPLFDLGQNVLLIDSPGIDAYGLEVHEKLTLETLVPTIDICIYVTTMKANSDRKAEEILNVVARYDCPLVIVQNMLDAVRPSPSGDKSSEQVALDHLKRVKRIVDRSEIKKKDSVEVVQLSAENAKKWKLKKQGDLSIDISENEYRKSRYEEFVKVTRHFLDIRKPDIEFQRIESISHEIEGVISDINSELNGMPVPVLQKCNEESLIQDVKTTCDRLEKDYKLVIEMANKVCDKLFDEIKNASEKSIEACTNHVNEHVTLIGNEIYEIIKKGNDKLIDYAREVNIPVRDVLKSPSFELYKGINVEKKVKNNRERVKDSGIKGFFNRIKNMFTDDDSGYHYETKTEVVIDVVKTQKLLMKRLNESLARFEKIYNDWLIHSFQVIINNILDELNQIMKANIARKEAAIRNEKLSKIASLLFDLLRKLEKQQKKLKKSHRITTYKMQYEKKVRTDEFEVNKLSEYIVSMAGNAIKKQHTETMQQFISSKGLFEYQPIVIGWDDLCIEEFRFQSGIVDLVVADLTQNNDFVFPNDNNRCIFLMVNATQIGAAEKQIRNIRLEDIISSSDYLIWVIQDFEEVLNGNNVGEAIQGMLSVQKTYLTDVPSSIWVVHRNPVYNICLLNYQAMNILTLKDENEFIHDIQREYSCYCDDVTIKNIGKIIRKSNFIGG